MSNVRNMRKRTHTTIQTKITASLKRWAQCKLSIYKIAVLRLRRFYLTCNKSLRKNEYSIYTAWWFRPFKVEFSDLRSSEKAAHNVVYHSWMKNRNSKIYKFCLRARLIIRFVVTWNERVADLSIIREITKKNSHVYKLSVTNGLSPAIFDS